MSVVQDATGTQVVRHAAIVLLAGVSLAGCGGSSDSNEAGASHSGARVGEIQLADCSDWRQGSVRKRYGTIRDIRDFLGGPVGTKPGGHGAVLDDGRAYKLFENYCKQPFAKRFKLYKLYARAAAFTPQQR